MNQAQEKWKEEYRNMKFAPIYVVGGNYPKYSCRGIMRDIRREAALERKLEAAQRTIETQAQRIADNTMRINGVLRVLNDGADKWQHIAEEDTGGCCLCGYDWPCRYETIRRALMGLDDQNMRECNVPSNEIEIEPHNDPSSEWEQTHAFRGVIGNWRKP